MTTVLLRQLVGHHSCYLIIARTSTKQIFNCKFGAQDLGCHSYRACASNAARHELRIARPAGRQCPHDLFFPRPRPLAFAAELHKASRISGERSSRLKRAKIATSRSPFAGVVLAASKSEGRAVCVGHPVASACSAAPIKSGSAGPLNISRNSSANSGDFPQRLPKPRRYVDIHSRCRNCAMRYVGQRRSRPWAALPQR